MKPFIPLLLTFLLTLAGCAAPGGPPSMAGDLPAPAESKSTLTLKPTPAPDSPEKPQTPSAPEVQAPAPSAPSADEQLVREILKLYGAQEETGEDGSSRLVIKGAGLFQEEKSWNSPVELDGLDYFEWFRSTTIGEDPAYIEEHYRHPGGEEYFFFPQDIYEERIQKYFDVSTDHLRRDKRFYDPELKGYWRGGGGGRGETAELSYTYAKSGDDLTIRLTRTYPSGAEVTGTLWVRLTGDGGWNYRRGEWFPPQVFSQGGSALAELEELTPEQRRLVERGEELVRLFQVDSYGIPGEGGGSASGETKELDGRTYQRYGGTRYRGWEDFRADLLTVLTPEFFQELNGAGGQFERGIFTGEEGELYFLGMGRGTDRTYLGERTRYRVVWADKECVLLCRCAYYCDSAADPEKDPEPASCRECPIALVNTAEGWRVAEMTLPY